MSCNQEILADKALGDDIVRLCTSADSVSSLLATTPSLSPGEAWKQLYGDYKPTAATNRKKADDADLDRAAQCGKWGPTQPSDTFLRIYRDVLAVVEESPDRAMVSPPLLGSCGVTPLTIISTIPDIVRHMANVIARAEKEVFLATNYWQDSVASTYLTNAIRELDRRAGQRGARIVMKIIYDRGSPKQFIDPHHLVGEDEYTGKNVALPASKDIPNISMEVMNYHQPIMGTFHSKYMVVDRKIAILQSNNIQDNDNVEMMVHFEGPIVDSFYDMALLSWNRKLEPPLPSRNSPASVVGSGSYTEQSGEVIAGNHPAGSLASTEGTIEGQTVGTDGPIGVTSGVTAKGTTHDNPSDEAVLSKQMQEASIQNTATELLGSDPRQSEGSRPAGSASSTKAEGLPPKESTSTTQDTVQQKRSELRPNKANGPDPGIQAFLDSGKQQIPRWCLKQPSSSIDLPQNTSEHPQYDEDIAREIVRVQASLLPRPGKTEMEAITRLLNHTTNHLAGDAPDFSEGDEMTPYIPHDTQTRIPMAMVNRPPYGTPTHYSVVQPQNVAWLSALRHARKNIFIQTPTLNAEPLIPAIREACERGLDVVCYICMGYNDTGELLPKQGGTNEMIAHKLYGSLSDEGRKHLHYFWYVGKDQTRPIPQIKKNRDCHIKLMIVDESIGIMGNGNQDTQSWYHSQEINIMLESSDVCRAWIEGLRRNQNTHIYGMVGKADGIWRDNEGIEAEGAMGIDPGHFSWFKGVVGAIKRAQGKGGF
ncbi:iq calmodulin-binding motif protein [Grosmannia clavigera kw1407]|uniref:Iq calmodulin-binding motif protein n=1 Tax=Grosmannia clavigera (strain kw1407 / UAMH 11150) TaxID=655863 RepID=F0X8C9_GROCL|nr:iq calmodulin-binding motif protein [Grosmannia clavigera kw1407]EFX05520.1 iq calmodulin-binding motif protein [Grosmannia clavigera kw1407]